MTERPKPDRSPGDRALRVVRRAAHALRNAQNAAVVNLEVVRSRSSAGAADASVKQFLDNAGKGMEDAARLADALLAICSALISAASEDKLSVIADAGGTSGVELVMKPEEAGALVRAVLAAGEGLGVAAEPSAQGAILRIPLENEAN